jgi:hypothetical protein
MTLNFLLKWSACAITLAGATATALGSDPLNVLLLNTGAVLYFVWGYRIREWNLMVINGGLILIYLAGLYLRFC